MKQKIFFSLGLACVLSVVLTLMVLADPGNVMVVSDEDTRVYYAAYDPVPEGWKAIGFDDSAWQQAVDFPFSGYLNPEFTQPFPGSGAGWISFTSVPEDLPDYYDPCMLDGESNFATYLFRKQFSIPAAAYNISGIAAAAADNFGWLYLNGELIVSPTDLVTGLNFLPGYQTIEFIQPANLGCENILAGQVENGVWIFEPPYDSGHGPMGLVFMLYLNYQIPNTVWRRPVSAETFEVLAGSTLPLKFQLWRQDGTLLTEAKDIHLVVYGPSDSGWGPEVVRWERGVGRSALHFDPYESMYIGIFHTRDFSLQAGGLYTAVVLDSCSGDVLGVTSFVVVLRGFSSQE